VKTMIIRIVRTLCYQWRKTR